MSAEQFLVHIPGRFITGYGWESSSSRFYGVNVYNDATTGIIWIENQVSLGSSETVLVEESFVKCLWGQACVNMSPINSDNSIFASDPFRLECDNKHQEQSLSVVGSQHQNTRAYISIMVHSSFNCIDHWADEISLWLFATNHDVWFYKLLSNYRSGITPLELLTS